VATYARALAAETGDDRVAAAGSVISSALFAPRSPEPSACAWVDAVLADLTAAEPAEHAPAAPAGAVSS